jgi:hypothetical protein
VADLGDEAGFRDLSFADFEAIRRSYFAQFVSGRPILPMDDDRIAVAGLRFRLFTGGGFFLRWFEITDPPLFLDLPLAHGQNNKVSVI